MALERDFERYEGGPCVATQDRVHVTLQGKGVLYYNANTHRLLGRPEAITLYFSRTRDTIAIEPADLRQPRNFPVKPQFSGFKICVAPFLRHHRIPIGNAQRFIDADIDANGCLILDLTKTINVARPQKKKRSTN